MSHPSLNQELVAHGGKNDVTTHICGKQHKRNASVASFSKSVSAMFQSQAQVSEAQIGAEARWSFFVAKNNIAFLTSDHATKLFSKMFPNSLTAK